MLEEVAIVAAVRTPVGKFQGSLSALSATRLGAVVVREVVRRAGLEPAQVDECIMGNVLPAGLGQNPARQAALYGGLPNEVAALTINKVCGSGLKAVGLAVQAIQTGNAAIVIAGGMESMTNAPTNGAACSVKKTASLGTTTKSPSCTVSARHHNSLTALR